MPTNHLLEQYLDAHVTAAGLAGQKNVPLFPTLGDRDRLTLMSRVGDRPRPKLQR